MKYQPYKVLIVDNNTAQIRSLDDALRREGYDTLHAKDGYWAVEELKENNHDLVIGNVDAPNIYAEIALKYIHKHLKGLPFIALTEKTNRTAAINYMRKGALSYLRKTNLNPEEVIGLIERSRRLESTVGELYDENHLLLAYENDAYLSGLSETFMQNGYRVTPVTDDVSMFKKLRNNEIDVIVMGKKLGEGNIQKLIKRINKNFPYVTVIMNAELDTGDGVLQSSANFYPFDSRKGTDQLLPEMKKIITMRNETIAGLINEGEPNVWAIAGPPGAGKTLTVDRVTLSLPCTARYIRDTERYPGPGEINGEDHIFRRKNSYFPMHRRDFFYTFRHSDGNRVGFEDGVIESYMDNGYDTLIPFTNPDSFLKMRDKLWKDKRVDMKTILLITRPDLLKFRSEERGRSMRTKEQYNASYNDWMQLESEFDLRYSTESTYGMTKQRAAEFQEADMRFLDQRISQIINEIVNERDEHPSNNSVFHGHP